MPAITPCRSFGECATAHRVSRPYQNDEERARHESCEEGWNGKGNNLPDTRRAIHVRQACVPFRDGSFLSCVAVTTDRKRECPKNAYAGSLTNTSKTLYTPAKMSGCVKPLILADASHSHVLRFSKFSSWRHGTKQQQGYWIFTRISTNPLSSISGTRKSNWRSYQAYDLVRLNLLSPVITQRLSSTTVNTFAYGKSPRMRQTQRRRPAFSPCAWHRFLARQKPGNAVRAETEGPTKPGPYLGTK